MKDYYKILEVEENSSDEDIKKNYRTLSKKYHPDVNPQGAEKFKEIAEAYETLSDKGKRTQYDSKRKNPYSNTPFENMFSQMFGNEGPNFTKRKNAPDKIIKIQVSPIESYFGLDKTISYLKENHCNFCGGSGGEQQGCNTCGGSGFQIRTFGTGFMVQQIRTACQSCNGRGYILVKKCGNCIGRGVITGNQELKISIPKGADNGQFLKIQGYGDFKNGDYGDLIMQVDLIAKDNFEKINNDLIYNIFLTYEDLQRDKIIVPHPDGELSVSVPKIFDSSKPLRVRGKGYDNGDLYVKLFVKFERQL